MDFSRITPTQLSEERLDASYYGTQYLRNEAFLKQCGLAFKPIGAIAERCNCGATPKEVVYDGKGQGLIRTSDVRPNSFNDEGVLRTSALAVLSNASVAAISGDLLYTMSGTIGYAAVIPPTNEVFSFSNTIARVRLPKDGQDDSHFIAVFFNCAYGFKQSLRLVSGGIQGHVMPNPFKKLPVPRPHSKTQRYIGDKVRQAERLRARAREAKQDAWVKYLNAIRSFGYNEVDSMRFFRRKLNERLDPAYYSPTFSSVLDAEWLASRSQPLSNFIAEGSYGVLPDSATYRTGSERLLRATDLAACNFDTNAGIQVPSDQVQHKAQVKENDILLEVKGAIAGCVVASKLAVGKFVNGSVYRFSVKGIPVGYLALHLSGPIKRKYCAREAVNNIIQYLNLDCIRRLPVLRLETDVEEQISEAYLSSHEAQQHSFALITAAKLLVEASIEGKLSEAELKEAQEALERGEREADRAILARLTRKGIDVAGEPSLFPDLDALYAALDQAAVAQEQMAESCTANC